MFNIFGCPQGTKDKVHIISDNKVKRDSQISVNGVE